jgi:serine/threonine protein phosphatase PrpC
MSAPGHYRYGSAAATHVGTVRTLNEDAWLDRPDLGLWAVADGMGGHEAGDYASRAIVHALHDLDPPANAPEFLSAVGDCLAAVHADLRGVAAERGVTLIGSTVVVFLTFDGHFACLWAGDSRLYRVRDGDLEQITKDHSQVQELVDSGVIDADAAEQHPAANVITRAVGAGDTLDLDLRQGRIEQGDLFLLCSDGLFKALPEREIAAILASDPIETAAQRLIEQALAAHASDNVTVVIVAAREDVESP